MSTAFDNLPFVSSTDGRITSLWNMQPTGDYAADNRTGHQAAELLVRYMARSTDTACLPLVMKAIVDRQQWSGIEVGFVHALGEMAINAAA